MSNIVAQYIFIWLLLFMSIISPNSNWTEYMMNNDEWVESRMKKMVYFTVLL